MITACNQANAPLSAMEKGHLPDPGKHDKGNDHADDASVDCQAAPAC